MISRDALTDLAKEAEALAVSLYLTFRTEPDRAHENAVRLRNMVRDAEGLAEEHSEEARDLVDRVRNELEGLDLPRQPGTRGLGLFCTAHGGCRIVALPMDPGDKAVIDRGFHLHPLLPLFNDQGRFFVVAVERACPRLIQADRFGAEVVESPAMQDSFDKIRGLTELQADIGFHPAGNAPSPAEGGGAPPNVMHALGDSPADYEQTQLDEYVHGIAQAVDKELSGRHDPLVVAGDPNLVGMYRKHSRYAHLADDALIHATDDLDADTLADLSRDKVDQLLRRPRENAVSQVAERVGRGDKEVALHFETILAAAKEGRVDTLVIAEDQTLPARLAEQRDAPDLTGRPVADLSDEMLRETVLHGGAVFCVGADALPKQAPAAALLRY
ncbi:MAG: hypothetical protein ACFB22_12870 [Rhodothalassiaceae bacterium]